MAWEKANKDLIRIYMNGIYCYYMEKANGIKYLYASLDRLSNVRAVVEKC